MGLCVSAGVWECERVGVGVRVRAYACGHAGAPACVDARVRAGGRAGVSARVRAQVRAQVRVCMWGRVRVSEPASERGSVRVSVGVGVWVRVGGNGCVCVRERASW